MTTRRFLLALVVASASLRAQQPAPLPLTTSLPTDPKITIGTLPNGLRYYIRQNPKPEKRVERAFQILSDWARGQTLDSTEVVNERGVVREEWRTGRGAGERMLQQFLPIALKGSIYAKRLPIGTKESIESATPSRLRGYYDK